ncbi:MAG: ankyrin repeat domain-containing protein [Phycisphaerales bacterium]
MTRFILAVMLYLGLGAATTVGVAWLLAAIPFKFAALELVGEEVVGDWKVLHYDGPGAWVVIRVDPEMGSVLAIVDRTQALELPVASEVLEMPVRESEWGATEEARGWPAPALRCLWRFVDDRVMIENGIETKPWDSVASSPWDESFVREFFVRRQRALPTKPILSGVVIDSLFWAAIWIVLSSLAAAPLSTARWWRGRTGKCRRCGYQLAQSQSDQCSECGLGSSDRLPLMTSTRLAMLTLALVGIVAANAVGAGLAMGARVGPTDLHRAALEGNTAVIAKAIEDGHDPNLRVATGEEEERGATPLMYAARGGHVDIIRQLIELGADPQLASQQGEQAIHWVIDSGNTEALHALLTAGADPNAPGRGFTPLVQACIRYRGVRDDHYLEVIRILLNSGADPNASFAGTTALGWAAKNGAVSVVKLLLEAGAVADPSVQSPPILYAVAQGHFEVTRILVEHGATVGRPDHYLLDRAVASGSLKLVDYLLDHGAFLYDPHGYPTTALHSAAYSLNRPIVLRLLEAGIDPTIRDAAGHTALEIAELHHDRVPGWFAEALTDAERRGNAIRGLDPDPDR